MNERKYFIKQSWIFNLEAMQDKLHCIGYDMDDGILEGPISILGYTINDSDDLQAVRDECFNLEWAAKTRKVTGKEFGRIKEIVEWRVNQRYMTCIQNGLDDYRAGACFDDL